MRGRGQHDTSHLFCHTVFNHICLKKDSYKYRTVLVANEYTVGLVEYQIQLVGSHISGTWVVDWSLISDFCPTGFTCFNSTMGNIFQGNCQMGPFALFPFCQESKTELWTKRWVLKKGKPLERKYEILKVFNLKLKSVSLFTLNGDVNVNQLLFREKFR